MPETVTVTFQAQEWNRDLPQPADRTPNRVTFEVPYEEAITDNGVLPPDDSLESDVLAEHNNAPNWVNEWIDERKGPFYIETEVKN